MAKALIFDGNRYAFGPTLDFSSFSTLRIESDNCTLSETDTGTIWSQAASSTSKRDFTFYNLSGGMDIIVGAAKTDLGSFSDVFGASSVTNATIAMTLDLISGDISISVNGAETFSSVVIVGSNINTLPGMLFGIGARHSTDTPGATSGGYVMPAGEIGDTRVFTDGSLIRNYVSDGSGDVWADTENGQDANVYFGTGDATQWSSYGAETNPDPTPTADIVIETKGFTLYQRKQGGRVVPISVTVSGITGNLERSINGGFWDPVEVNPADGTYTDDINLTDGSYNITYRDSNAPTVTATVNNIGVGAIFVTAGSSNNSGSGIYPQTYQRPGTATGHLFGNDYKWKELEDPYDSGVNQVDTVSIDPGAGSWVPRFVNHWLASTPHVPVAFVPCAKGGSNVGVWYQSTDPVRFYGSMYQRIQAVGGEIEGIITWMGGNSLGKYGYTEFKQLITEFADNCRDDFNCPVYTVPVQHYSGRSAGEGIEDQDGIRQAMQDAAWDNPNLTVLESLYDIDLSDGDGVHLKQDDELNEGGLRFFNSIHNGYKQCRISIESESSLANKVWMLTLADSTGTIVNEPVALKNGYAATAAIPTNDPTLTGTLSDGITTYELSGPVGGEIQGVTNAPPIADAGISRTYTSGETATLDASASTDDDSGMEFLWAKVSGPAVNLQDDNQVIASYVAPTVTDTVSIVFQVTVTDADGESSTSTVTHTIEPIPNTLPEANAGPDQTVASGEPVNMAGVLTDADNDNVSGIWSVHSVPAGVNVVLGNVASPTMQWEAPIVNSDTDIVLAYTPFDGKEYGDPALVTITVLKFVEQVQSVLSGDITLGVPPVGSYQVRLYTNVYDTKTIVYDGSVAITQAGFSFTDVSLPVGTTVYGFALHPVHGGFPIKGVTQ